MSLRRIGTNLLSLNRNVQPVWHRTLASASYDWKILGLGAGKQLAAKAEQSLKAQGYANIKLMGVNNTNDSDRELRAVLQEQQWDAVSIGGYVNGFDNKFHPTDDNIPRDRAEVLMWFNRVLNLIHEQAPKAKIILVKSPEDIHPAIQRVMQGDKGQNK